MMRRVIHAGIVLTALLAAAAAAQTFPSKPIRIIVPYGAGGVPDVLARAIAQKMAENLGGPIVVDNRPGASGVIAAELVMNAPADGHTLWVADTGHLAVNPALQPKLPYDPLKDFAPVTLVKKQAFFVFVDASLPVHSIKELVELSKSRPGGLFYGSVGNGSVHHLSIERLKLLTGANLVHVPYKFITQVVPALVAGDVSVMVSTPVPIEPQLKAGKARALAIGASERSRLMPEVPTLAEAGVPGLDIEIATGFLAARATPREIVQRLRTEIVKALADPVLKQRFKVLGFDDIVGNTPEEYAELIRSELRQYRKVVKDAGIRAD